MKNTPKILFISYETKSLKVSQQALQLMGYRNYSYSLTGDSCLCRLDNSPYLIFMDINEDYLAGFETIKQIKTRNENSRVIILLDDVHLKFAHQVLKCGAFDYLIKGMNEERQVTRIMTEIQEMDADKKQNKIYRPNFLKKLFQYRFFTSLQSTTI